MTAGVIVRQPLAGDREAFLALWRGYCAFYQAEVPERATQTLWRRVLDPADTGLRGLIACVGDAPLGFATLVTHPGTWSDRPVGYLEDLFVDGATRGQGLGRALIAGCAELGREEGWLRLYWQTGRDNVAAQALYDRVATRTDWVRYELQLNPR
ncbi:GNAT family N-acetyltransferase [Rhodospirillum rubrum]|uniref:GCN5-related N-acetyltransferase n=1 Tax=Rhodospirillum rubrum (strain ATCC 11170 / ATH 1.1.1 / DSM 467 / LMG 4362 / NCIMB 8255 / S1) TaxID=269796 RepID=Q2RNP3_RHORT|nr:GNAT family N-acetyltransferase [Rhodospirillum rubrum]ABC24252.1 GCN5-related N-acetyltransferase [Rhodospirillum rubrum ATCC 11170]AEO50003.1 GCN5-related N-acetyltransferase [Rhodospirillum rubrum F11]MBK5955970.1 N-acetyltransferase [Rhodospirillum rubrum]QXG80184.1 GNAT family N-acetyltransferase [Rhodospirillum rubrum]HCF16618.1 N-acetyltransferase [Rhodospirillum rubrum]